MLTYVARRVLVSVPTVLGVATVIFIMVRLLPGDPARVMAGLLATEEDVARIRHQLGLDQPLLLQYLGFMGRLLRGDLGTSTRTGDPVLHEILVRLPYTAELALVATTIAVVVGVAAGILAATRRNTWIDLFVSGGAVFGLSMPVYWLGLMLIILFAIQLHALPAAGSEDPLGFVLPSITLALFSIALVARQSRSAMLEVLGQDYVRTARAKGAAPRTVLLKHALRNALLPALTIVGFSVAFLITGAVLVEQIFSWPGIGSYAVTAAESLDFPAIMGVTIVGGAAFLIASLVTDLAYAVADPQIRLS